MDIKIQTKITVLLEKIHYLNLGIQQHGGMVSKVDKDLLTNYVRELYELVLSLPSTPQPGYPDHAAYMYQAGYQPPGYIPPQDPSQYQPQSAAGYTPPSSAPIGNVPTPQPQTFRTQQPAQQPAQQQNGNYAPQPPQEQRPVNGQPNPEPVQQPQHQTSPLNPAFTLTNGKRTLSDSIRIKTGAEQPSLNERFRKDDRDLAGKMQLTPIKDLKTFIGLNKRFSYINFLFGNDANLYDEAVEKLNTSGSRETAMDYMDNLLRPRLKWTDDNDMVAEFYQLVERRYM